jgi:hypothetical protein
MLQAWQSANQSPPRRLGGINDSLSQERRPSRRFRRCRSGRHRLQSHERPQQYQQSKWSLVFPGGNHASQSLHADNGHWGTGSDLNTKTPEIFKATGDDNTVTGGSNSDFLTGDVLFHGPNGSADFLVAWTEPSGGLIDIAGSIWRWKSAQRRCQRHSEFRPAQPTAAPQGVSSK